MAHAPKPDFVFRINGLVHLNRRGASVQSTAGQPRCAHQQLDTPCSEVVWRVLATHCIRQFHLHFPFRSSPCAITFQLESTAGTTGHLKCDGTRAETRFRFRRNRRVHLNWRGRQFSQILASRGVRIGGSNAGYTMFRGSVKDTGYPLHSPVSPFTSPTCSSPCAITFQLESTAGTTGHLKWDGKRAETRFRFRRNRRVHLNWRGRQFSRLLASRGVRISSSNAGYTMFRGSVKGTGYPLHSPVSPSLPLLFHTVCHHISAGVYHL